jgi:hypothetical protein
MNEQNKNEENLEGYDVVDEYFPLWTRANYHDSGILLLSRTMRELVKVCRLLFDYGCSATAGYRVSADGLSLSPYIEFRASEDSGQGMVDLERLHRIFLTSKSEYLKRFHIGEVEFLQDSISFQITARMDGSAEDMRTPENELLGFAVNELWVRRLWAGIFEPLEPSDYLVPHRTSICPICHQTTQEAEDMLFSLCQHILHGTAKSIEIYSYLGFECKECSINLKRYNGIDQITNICYPCFVEIYTNWRRKQLGPERNLAQN